MLERDAVLRRGVGEGSWLPGQSVLDMLALKTEQLGPAVPESNRDGSVMFRSGCMLLEAVTGTIASRCPPLCCVVCQWLPRSPVTLPCGYTGCKRCLGQSCPHCGALVSSGLEQNVLVKAATEKWWPKELEAERLREQGVALAQEDLLEEAIAVLDAAVNLCEYPSSVP